MLNTNHENTFLGFFSIGYSESLSFDETYYVEIALAELVGKNIHLLIRVSADDNSKGLISEVYDVTSSEFYELIENIFEDETGSVVAVSTDSLECVCGFSKLKMRGARAVVDWKTFDAETLPVNELSDDYA